MSVTGSKAGRPRVSPHVLGSAPRSQSAFTLVEILVVVAIAGLLVTLAVVNLFPSDAQLSRRDAAAVAMSVEHARDAAWFGGRPTAITFSEGRTREWRFDGRGWQPDGKHDRALPAGLEIAALHVDGQPLRNDERLIFLPDGLGIPFSVSLKSRGLGWAVEGDAAGAVRLAER